MTKYLLKMTKHYVEAYDAMGEFIDEIKEITVRTMDGREKKWKVGKKILGDDKLWQEFLMAQVVPFVEEWDEGGIIKL